MSKITVEELQIIITAQNNQAKAQIKGIQDQLKGFQTQAQQATTKTTSYFKTMAKSIAAIGIGKIIKDSFTSGMDFVESENLFEVSFGDASKQAREWSESYSKALGLVASEQRKNAGTLYNMFSSMGIGKDSYNMATGLTELANDMASFYNLTSDEAFVKLKAGIIGEAEPLRAIGIIVDENTVKQYAYKMGIAEVGDELTAQQKVLARYQAILAQTSNAQGDLARTMDSPANQLRRLQAQFTEFKQQIGVAFIPLLNSVMPALTGALQIITPAFAGLANGISWVAQAVQSAGQPAKILMMISVGCAVAFGVAAIAAKGYAAAQLILKAVQAVLIPQTITFGAVLKASLGWIGLVAGAIGLLWSLFGNTSKDTKKTSNMFDGAALSANKAASGVDNMSDSLGDLAKQTGKLAGFDEIDVLDDENNGLMNNLLGTNWQSNVDNALQGIGDITQGVDGIQESIDNLDPFKKLKEWWSDIVWGWDIIITHIKDNAKKLWDDLKSIVSDSIEWWKGLFSGIFSKVKGFFGELGSIVSSSISWWKDLFKGVIDDIKATLNNNPIYSAVKSWAAAGFNAVSEVISKVQAKWKEFIDWVTGNKSTTHTSSSGTTHGGGGASFGSGGGRGFATGGFPETGQLFLAREAGPEMVGSMGGRTAVANNSQIVDGIASGVYRAIAPIAERLIQSNRNGDIYLDGVKMSRQLTPYLENENNRKGGSSSVQVI